MVLKKENEKLGDAELCWRDKPCFSWNAALSMRAGLWESIYQPFESILVAQYREYLHSYI